MKRRTFILLGGGAIAAAGVGASGLVWREHRRRRRTAKAEQLPPLETQTLAQLRDTDQFDHMGTCRMGTDPQKSVVNADLRLHDSSNTCVIGSSVFASSGAGHPTLLITALAHRLGEHLVSRLGGVRNA